MSHDVMISVVRGLAEIGGKSCILALKLNIDQNGSVDPSKITVTYFNQCSTKVSPSDGFLLIIASLMIIG